METVPEPFSEEPAYKPSTHSANPPRGTRVSVAANAIGYALNEARANEAGVVHVTAAEAALHQRIAERVVSQLDEYDEKQRAVIRPVTEWEPPDTYILRPGDILVLRMEVPITMERAATIKRRALESLPGLRDVVIIDAAQMEIFREVTDDATS